ncbi:nucleolin 1-like isoform X2 [Gastrolobium bilobum]|uniref:nucleolin 1-like isoform X2 n=1 Tax=Gastrolobium bilobum TaxID=150636 RepID=UPI002AAF3D30|nr:nucleolin 1-like isoform X2 [Gastrolobium bilobum]
MTNESDTNDGATATATAIPPLSNEKRVCEDEDGNQLRSKRQKIDEIAEEPKNKGEIISNDSSSDSEQNKGEMDTDEGDSSEESDDEAQKKMTNESDTNDGATATATAIPPLSNEKRVCEDEDGNQLRSKRQKIDEIAEEPKNKGEIISNDSSSDSEQNKGEMDTDEGDSSEESDDEAQKKMTNESDTNDGATATAIPPLSNEKRVCEDEDENQLRSKRQKIDEIAEEPKNKGEIISNDSSSDSEQNKPVKGSDSSKDNEEEIEEKASKTAQLKTPATQKEKNAASKTIYVRNLSYSVERSDMENLFKECGEIVDVRLHTDNEGRFKGFGHVEFAIAEAAQKALELDNTELLRRPIKVGIAWERGLDRSNLSNSFQKGETVQSQTVFVKGFDRSLGEEKIKASLEEHFGSCGEITRISIPKFHDSGAVKGFAHLDFKDVDSLKNALQLHRTEFGGYPLLVQKAKPRYYNQDIGHGRGVGGHQFDGRDGVGHGGTVGWRKSSGGHQFCGRDGSDHGDRVNWGRSGGGHEFGVRDGDGHSGRVGWGRSSGGHKFCGRDGGDPGGRVDWGRSGGDHQFDARNGSDHGGTVGWRSSRGGHQFCGRDGGNNSGKVGWGRISGGHQFCGRDEGDLGCRMDWGKSGGDLQYGVRDGGGHGDTAGWGSSSHGDTAGWGSSSGGHHQFCGRDGGGQDGRVDWRRNGGGWKY